MIVTFMSPDAQYEILKYMLLLLLLLLLLLHFIHLVSRQRFLDHHTSSDG